MKTFFSRSLIAIIIFLFAYTGANSQTDKQKLILDIKTFGAKGDGVVDDYKAFLAAAKQINDKGGGTLLLPKGVYYIGAYHTATDTVPDILFKNCEGLNITGENAVISVNGNFKRSADFKKRFSKTNAIIPLSLVKCKDVMIRGIEINGNVDKMIRDSGVVEGPGYLIKLAECENVSISHVFVHHAQSDGIYIGGGKNPNMNFHMDNCISSNNARQGLSVTFLYNAVFKNCKFLNTGFTEGKYRPHGPMAGVDIEPHNISPKTGKIVFDSCYFENNRGSQFVCTSPKSTSNIILRNCSLSAKNGTSPYQVILAADSVLMENCEMDLSKGSLWPCWKPTPGGSSTIKNCIIRSSSQGILCTETNDTIHIENNTLIYTGKEKMTSYFPYLGAKNLYFINNKVFIPSSVMKLGGVQSLVQNGIIAKGNKFYSDSPQKKPKVSYRGMQKTMDNQ